MPQLDREDRIRRAIVFYAALGILIIGTIVAVVAIAPLYARLKSSAENSLSHAVNISTIAVDEILSRAKDLSLQVTSRTQIRKRLEAYNRGDIPLGELVAFSTDKLSEAMNLSAEISGITRLGPDGTALIETGLALPARDHWPVPADGSHEVILRGPVTMDGTAYLLVGAHIFGAGPQQVGTDVIVFRMDSLQAVISDYTGLGETGERVLAHLDDGRMTLFFPLRHEAADADLALPPGSPVATGLRRSSTGESGLDHARDADGRPHITAYAPLKNSDWGLVVTMDPDELFLAVQQLILLVIVVISLLVLAGTFGIVRLIRPLSNTLHHELVRRREAEDALRRQQDHLEELVKGRTTALCNAYREMESFSYSVSHDLRAPLRSINGFSRILEEDYAPRLDEEANAHLQRIRKSVTRMDELIDSLLQLSRLSRRSLQPHPVDMSGLARAVIMQLREQHPAHPVDIQVDDVPPARGDEKLLRVVLENLIGNAWKYSAGKARPEIRFGSREDDGNRVYFVQDNGVGFDMHDSDRLFGVFQRLHSSEQFEGTGIGLATVKRIIDRHGGRVWAEARNNEGATFYFTLPETAQAFQDEEWRSACA